MSIFSHPLVKSGAYTLSSLFAGTITTTSVQAAPYHTTDLAAADSFEIKIFSEYSSVAKDWEVEGPALNLTLPVRPGLETSITIGRGWAREDNAPVQKGWLDTEWAAKWEIIPVPKEGGFGLTTEPALFIPTGARGIGGKEWQFEIPLVVGWKKGRTGLRAFAAYGASFESKEDQLRYGAVAEYDITERLTMGAEISGETPLSQHMGHELSGDIGFTYDLGRGLELQARFSHSIHTADHVARKGVAVFLEKAF